MTKGNLLLAGLTLAAGFGIAKGYQWHLEENCPEPKPAIYKDLNNDGIEDIIEEKKVYVPLIFGIEHPHIKKTELYGVKLVNGNTKYVPKEIFETYLK